MGNLCVGPEKNADLSRGVTRKFDYTKDFTGSVSDRAYFYEAKR